jgi:hypothetical protein
VRGRRGAVHDRQPIIRANRELVGQGHDAADCDFVGRDAGVRAVREEQVRVAPLDNEAIDAAVAGPPVSFRAFRSSTARLPERWVSILRKTSQA